ncbi:unnamed protein product [Cyprideis torosa]|uniref:Uncharacterized protein n=1 Tax=Cyprideis torosa TaxID=163714 RepID=A0A7R8ZNT1_9CRUS|nr:unnamed protein product [Cyprideis torosa]CAG0897088.1 unnamed protein product [Cyprideis torosa]
MLSLLALYTFAVTVSSTLTGCPEGKVEVVLYNLYNPLPCSTSRIQTSISFHVAGPGAEIVLPDEFPFIVRLRQPNPRGTYYCGGSVISNRLVFTAAHCVMGQTREEGMVLLNTELFIGSGGPVDPWRTTHKPEQIFVSPLMEQYWNEFLASGEPKFKTDYLEFTTLEAAIIRTSSEIKLDGKKISHLCLWIYPDWKLSKEFRPFTVVGWEVDTVLKKATNVKLPQSECRGPMFDRYVDPYYWCYGSDALVCGGDSGGPFVTALEDSYWVQFSYIHTTYNKYAGDVSNSLCRVFGSRPTQGSLGPLADWIKSLAKPAEFSRSVKCLDPAPTTNPYLMPKPPKCQRGQKLRTVVNFQPSEPCEKTSVLKDIQATDVEYRTVDFLFQLGLTHSITAPRPSTPLYKFCMGSIIARSIGITSCACLQEILILGDASQRPGPFVTKIIAPWVTGEWIETDIPPFPAHCHPSLEKQMASTPVKNWPEIFQTSAMDMAWLVMPKLWGRITHLCLLWTPLKDLGSSPGLYHFALVDQKPFLDQTEELLKLMVNPKLDLYKNTFSVEDHCLDKPSSYCIKGFKSSSACNSENRGGPIFTDLNGKLVQTSTLGNVYPDKTGKCSGSNVEAEIGDYNQDMFSDWLHDLVVELRPLVEHTCVGTPQVAPPVIIESEWWKWVKCFRKSIPLKVPFLKSLPSEGLIPNEPSRLDQNRKRRSDIMLRLFERQVSDY